MKNKGWMFLNIYSENKFSNIKFGLLSFPGGIGINILQSYSLIPMKLIVFFMPKSVLTRYSG